MDGLAETTLTIPVKITIGYENKYGGFPITIGNGLFRAYPLYIEQCGDDEKKEYRITDEIKHISDRYDTKEEAIAWLVKMLQA